MRKVLASLVVIPCLAVSSLSMAASGEKPQCASGQFNMVVVNKNLPSDSCTAANGKGDYCVYNFSLSASPQQDDTCLDATVLWKGTTESISLSKAPKRAQVSLDVTKKGEGKLKPLQFTYDNGSLTSNCSDVFGPNVKCDLTQSGDKKNPVYTLTISQ